MSLLLNIALLTFVCATFLAAFGGENWEKNDKALIKRITARGWISLFCVLAILGLGITKEVMSGRAAAREAAEAEKAQTTLQRQLDEANAQLTQARIALKELESQLLHTAYITDDRELPKIRVTESKETTAVVRFGGGRLWLGPGQTINRYGYAFRAAPDGTVLIDGEIRNRDGAIVAELRDSRLHVVSPGIKVDRNSDWSAIEIVDDLKQPILQVQKERKPVGTVLTKTFPVKDRDMLMVNLITYLNRTTVLVCVERTCYRGPINEKAKSYIARFERLFEYPGLLYPGKRVLHQSKGQ